ncbi:RING finger protein 17 [Microplitis demolitor]|uniref:RING finger protein 17 n=1 Tax=Microplitis demolitor TaxID=69319 RepID=UPI0004CCC631|nr:RING finger protein 17 [Microplitis demolitor]
MSVRSPNKLLPKPLNHPKVKLKNLKCIHCNTNFFVRDLNSIKGSQSPVLMGCGHTICAHCSREKKPCPSCQSSDEFSAKQAGDDPSDGPQFPLNIYVMGMMAVNKSRPVGFKYRDSPDFSFKKSFKAQVNDASNPDRCHECNDVASSKCLGCFNAFFCCNCFTQIHRHKINQSHTKVMIDGPKIKTESLQITCPVHPPNRLKEWCSDCKESCCNDCIVDKHRTHSAVSFEYINKMQEREFQDVYRKVGKMMAEVQEAKMKLKKALTAIDEINNTTNVEAEINRHFVFLHGALQIIEERVINGIHKESSRAKNAVLEIDKNLQSLDQQLQSAILMAVEAKEYSKNMNHQVVIEKLRKLLSYPCHLVEHDAAEPQKISFYTNTELIVEAIRKHCNVMIPSSVDAYKLVPLSEVDNTLNINGFVYSDDVPKLFHDQADDSPELSPSSSIVSDISRAQSPVIQSETEDSVIDSEISAINSTVDSSAASMASFRQTERQIRNGTQVEITYIKNPKCFYARLKSNEDKFKQLQKFMKKYDEIDGIVPKDVHEGSLYVIRRNKEPRWYRGRILEAQLDPPCFYPIFEVFAIDYGFTDKKVSIANIRLLYENLSDIPPLVNQHSLYDIEPFDGTWSEECALHMEEIIQSADNLPTLYMTKFGCEDLIIPVSPTTFPLSLRDALIFLGYGKFLSTEKLFRINPKASNAFHHEILATDQYFDAVYLNSYSPDCIYVRKASHNEKYFQNMVEIMTEDYKSTKKIKGLIYSPETGMHVAAPHNKLWYRGIVVDIVGIRTIQVLLVDLGVNVILDYTKIRRLDSRYTQSTIRAIKLRLKDVTAIDPTEDWPLEANTGIVKFMNSGNIRVVVYEKNVFDNFPEYSASIINKQRLSLVHYLEHLSLVKRTAPAGMLEKMESYFKEIGDKTTKASKNKKKKSHDKTDKKINSASNLSSMTNKSGQKLRNHVREEDPYKMSVKITLVQSPDEIYITPADMEFCIDDIHKQMQFFYNNHHTDDQIELVEDTVCVVFDEHLKLYFRAKIVKIKSLSEVMVFLLDVGETMTVSSDKLKTLADSLYEIPAYVVKVKLGGILPCGGSSSWPLASIQALREILERNGEFWISKVGEIETDAIVVDMYIREAVSESALGPTVMETNLVNRMLVDLGLALPVKGFNNQKLKVLAAELQHEITASNDFAGSSRAESETNDDDKDLDDDDEDEEIEDTKSEDSDKTIQEDPEDPEFLDPPFNMSESLPKDIPKWKEAVSIDTPDPFFAKVTYIDWDGYLYLHSVEKSEYQLQWIEKTLDAQYSNSQPSDVVWSPGDMCITQFMGVWSRAVVHRVDKKIAVEYIDYGNMDWQDPKLLRKELMLENIPRQATRCRVYDMVPNTPSEMWRREDLQKLHALLVDKVCRVTIVASSPEFLITVDLLQPEECHLARYVQEKGLITLKRVLMENLDEDLAGEEQVRICRVANGVGSIKTNVNGNGNCSDVDFSSDNGSDIDVVILEDLDNETTEIDDDEESCVADSNLGSKSSRFSCTIEELALHGLPRENLITTDGLQRYPRYIFPSDLKVFNAALGHVDASQPNIVYLHPAKNSDCKLLKFLSSKYSKLRHVMGTDGYKCPEMQFYDVGDPCIAIYSKDNDWYRCTILTEPISDGSIQVEYVDWGTVDWVRADEIRQIHPDWISLPIMAIKCRLWNTLPTKKSAFCREWLTKDSDHITQVVRVKGRENDHLVVQLYQKFGDDQPPADTLFYQPLIDGEYFKANVKDFY